MNLLRTSFDELLNFGKSRYEINVWAVNIINIGAVRIINVGGKQSTGLFSSASPHDKLWKSKTYYKTKNSHR